MPMAPPNCWKVWRTPETAPESRGSTTTSAAARGAVGERPQRHHRLLDPALPQPQHEQREQDDAEAHGAEGGRGPAAARSMDERPGQCHSPGRGGGGAG